MRKLRLEMDELEVESFEVEAAEKARGTVHGEERSIYCNTDEIANCSNYTCDPPSCPAESCGDCGTYYCASADPSCTEPSCVYSCTCPSLYTCPPTGCL
jgi:hypothetical protein